MLNYLVGRDPNKNLKKSGEIFVNQKNRDSIHYASLIAYVQQTDLLLQSMTVKECLMFSAKMKLSNEVDKEQVVQDLIDKLKLNKWAETRIGGPLIKGISGGERKRTSIGVELVTDPNLIFLDEPTTGLDSYIALNIIEVLKDLARSGKTIITTIHQPSSEIFNLFDQMMLMAEGKVLYFNSARFSVDYFRSIGYECPDLTNPADYFMSMMSIETYQNQSINGEHHHEEQRIQKLYERKVKYLADKYEESHL